MVSPTLGISFAGIGAAIVISVSALFSVMASTVAATSSLSLSASITLAWKACGTPLIWFQKLSATGGSASVSTICQEPKSMVLGSPLWAILAAWVAGVSCVTAKFAGGSGEAAAAARIWSQPSVPPW